MEQLMEEEEQQPGVLSQGVFDAFGQDVCDSFGQELNQDVCKAFNQETQMQCTRMRQSAESLYCHVHTETDDHLSYGALSYLLDELRLEEKKADEAFDTLLKTTTHANRLLCNALVELLQRKRQKNEENRSTCNRVQAVLLGSHKTATKTEEDRTA